MQAAGEPEGLRVLIGALGAKGPLSAVNYPAGKPVAAALRAAGADVVRRQLEMSLRL